MKNFLNSEVDYLNFEPNSYVGRALEKNLFAPERVISNQSGKKILVIYLKQLFF